jgi:hypothetical protein
MRADETKYSQKIAGAKGNYDWSVRFDKTGDGFVGISQFDGERIKDRILLSPQQMRALAAFAAPLSKARSTESK